MSQCASLWTLCILYVINYLLLVDALTVQGLEENCILSFIVPKEKIKSSCERDEQINRHINAMEMKVNIYKQQVADLQIQLEKQRQLNSERLEILERQVQATSANMDTHILTDRRLALLEKQFEQLNTEITTAKTMSSQADEESTSLVFNAIDNTNPSSLSNVATSMTQSEVKGLLDNFTKKFETYVQEQILLYNHLFNILPKRNDMSGHSMFTPQWVSPLRNKSESETRSNKHPQGDGFLVPGFEKLGAKVNDISDQIAKHIGTYINNITNDEYIRATEIVQDVTASVPKYENLNMMTNPELVVVDEMSENKESLSGENADTSETYIDDPFTSVDNDTSGKASPRISQHSEADANSTTRDFMNSSGDWSVTKKLNREELDNKLSTIEQRLKEEITVMLYSPLVELMSLVDKQRVTLEDKITLQDERCEQANKDLRTHISQLEESLRTINIHLQSLSQGFQKSLSKVESITPLKVLVQEIKNNITSDSRAQDNEEQSKKLKRLERLMGLYQQSLEHYRNETKHEYREISDSLEKEAYALKKFYKTVENNLTVSMHYEISKLNNSSLAKFQEINQQIRAYEESLLLAQIDIDNMEKILESRSKRSDGEFDDLADAVNQISEKQKDFKKKLEYIEQIQTSMNDKWNIYVKDVSALKTEVKLSLDEWLPLTFEFDSSRTECFGDQYIKRIRHSKIKLVGVVLCSPTRYKIFMSSSLQSKFLNIGDGSGMGEDHCEFVGGNKELPIKLSPFKPSFEAVQGFTRNQWGQEPVFSYLNAIKPSPHWYECGVKIP